MNKFLNYSLSKFDLSYTVNINENFDCIIKNRDIVDPEVISVGEAKIINISIALSYLNIILSKQQSNLIFLDEVLDGVDEENRYTVVDILRELCRKFNTNIIIVHHSSMDYNKFDRIIETRKVNKFSELKDFKIN